LAVVDGGGHVVEGGGLQAAPGARQRIVHMSTVRISPIADTRFTLIADTVSR
jgi:hypothetical protein